MPDGSMLYVRGEHLGPAQVPGTDDDEQEIAGRRPSLEQMGAALSGFTRQVGEALKTAAPTRYTLEFECEFGFEAGGLVALIGRGTGKSAFRVTMEWDRTTTSPTEGPDVCDAAPV
ncbi:CU044_2847 family protein [Streptomyces sp. SD15]